MLFNSLHFLMFFPVVVLLYFALPHKVRYIWLLACSYYFYMCWNPKYALLILTSTILTYLSGIGMEYVSEYVTEETKAKGLKKWCLIASFTVNLGILGYFKYCHFFLDNLERILAKVHITLTAARPDILLPVGISFYTFQALSYSADVYKGELKAEKNFFKYALFVSFFPQLVAGPIERSGKLLRQIYEEHKFSFERMTDGLLLMLWGYFLKMVVADRIAIPVDKVFNHMDKYGGCYIIVAGVLFAFQIYCDFAGYSTIALGAARVLGFELTDNFLSPYFSQSTSEFWNRWHVSLFGWFRDYLYIPLGGNRKGKLRKYLNIMIVFLVSGLWHGATWAFVIWGGLNGLFQIIGDLLMPLRDKAVQIFKLNRESLSHKIYRTVGCFVLVDFTWIFFRAGNMENAIKALKSIWEVRNPWILFDDSLFSLGLDWKNFLLMLAGILLLTVVDYCKYKGIVIRKVLMAQELWFRWAVYIGAVLGILLFGIWGSGYDAAAFIYFQF